MKETRIKKLFDLLSEHHTYITGEKLAQLLSVSTKTIRNELKTLDTIFSKNGGRVDSKSGLGYHFEVTDMEMFRTFIANKWHEYAFEEDTLVYKSNRVIFLLKIMLFEKDYIKAIDLCDRLQISKSQLSTDLQLLRQKIEPFQLHLDVRPHHGMKIIGKELNLRLCIANVVYNEKQLLDEEEFETQYILSEIRSNILRVFNHYHYETSELIFHNLVIHLFVALERVKIGEIGRAHV